MKELSTTITCQKGSSIRKMFNRAQGLDNIVSFGLGEPGFDTPVHIKQAAQEAIKRGETHYTVNAGILELREALSEKMAVKKGVKYNPACEIIITSGGVEALFLSFKAIINPGDEIIVGTPAFPNYFGQITLCGGKIVMVPLLEKDDFCYNVENLRKAVTDKTKAILINSPSNPIGSVTGEAILREIAKLCVEKDLYLVTDEVYQDFIYTDTPYFSIATCPGMKERTLIVDSFSKSYAMTGWRCGFVLGPEAIISQMVKMQESVVSCVNTPTQYAAMAALEGPQDVLKEMLAQYDENRKMVLEQVNQMKNVSIKMVRGAFYAFMNIKETGLTSEEFALDLLDKEHVVVVPGSGFGEGGEGYVRLSYVASREDTIEGLKRMKHYTDNL